MFPKSTKKGAMVVAFPDVCMSPGPPGAAGTTPVPYPNVGRPAAGAGGAARKVKIGGKAGSGAGRTSYAASRGDEAGTAAGAGVIDARLRAHLSKLNSQLAAMKGVNPNRWHQLLDDYAVTVSELYKLRASK